MPETIDPNFVKTSAPSNRDSGLSRKLHDLLHREAHLKLCRTQVTPMWTEKEAELRAVQARRPSILSYFSPRSREEYYEKLALVEAVVNQLRDRMALLDRCEPHITKLIEHELENLLREDCPEYMQALAAHRQKEDWCRCLDRFAAKIFEFTRALGNVRNLACSGYARHAQVYSSGALQAFGLAVEAAQLVEEEVKFANRISDTQLQLLRSTGVNTRPLPRLPETSFSGWVEKIKAMPLHDAQTQFDAIIDTTKKLHETGVPELRQQADQVHIAQEGDIKNFLRAAWDQFRGEVAAEIFPGDTERSVRETDELVKEAARRSVTGRA